MQEYKIGSSAKENLLKVIVNDYGDAIYLNPGDATFVDKFAQFLQYLENKDAELAEKAAMYGKQYEGRPMIFNDEDGNTMVDTEQIALLSEIKIQAYKECSDKLDALFGVDTLKKYFREFYEINPDFIPDDECIGDFIEQITPAIEKAYSMRMDKISKKYSKKRTGKRNKTKAELIAEAKAAKAAEADE